MSDPEPIDLSQLQNLNLAPDWVGDLQKREAAPGEVVWGRAPDHERESRGGGQGQGYGAPGGGSRGPRRDGPGGRGDFRQDRGGPPRGPRPDGPRGPRQDDRGPRPAGPGGFGGPRPDGPRGPRPDGPPRGPRPDDRGPRPGGPGGPPGDRGPRPGGPRDDRGPRPGGPPRDDRREGGGGGGRPDFRNNDRGRGPGRFDDRPQIAPLPGWRARLFAESRSLEAITRQVKASGRAYPVFELGRLFLAGRDRYVVEFSRQPQPQAPRNAPKGTPVPPVEPTPGPEQIFHIPSDGSLWLNREDAIRHLINGPSLKKFYRKEVISIDPPKGIFNAVAVCGFSGEILGPPNHHSFQTTVAKLHREQFYNLPIDRYKARIRTEKDETLVAKWLEQQSSATVYFPLTKEEIAAAAAAEAEAKAAKAASEAAAAASPGTPAAKAAAPTTDAAGSASESGLSESAPTAESESGIESGTAASEATTESTDPANESAPESPTAETVPVSEEAAAEAPVDSAAEPTADAESDSSSEASGEAPAAVESAPVEPLKNWAAVEAHFLANHADSAVRAVSRIKVPGNIPGKLLAPSLLALLRIEVEQQQRFPMQLVQDLCRDLEKESLKFFKRDKKATFVCRTRPHFIEDESHLSPRLRSIVGVVRANPGITVGKLVSTLAPHIEKPASKSDFNKGNAAPKPAVTPDAPRDTTAEATVQAPEAQAVPDSTEANTEVPAAASGTAAPALEAPTPAAEPSTAESSGTDSVPTDLVTSDTAETTVLGESTPAPSPEASAEPAGETAAAPASAEASGIESTEAQSAAPDSTESGSEGNAEAAVETPATADSAQTESSEAPKAGRQNQGQGQGQGQNQGQGRGEGQNQQGRQPKNQRGKKAPPAPEAPPAPLTMEEIGVLQDLRWLVQEGLVTEFATGELQILGRPPQPPMEKKVKGDPTKAPESPASTSDATPAPTETPAAAGVPAEEVPAPAGPETGAEQSSDETPDVGANVADDVTVISEEAPAKAADTEA
ncbi:MAG: hypothetical protein JWL81_1964 [Verrucomicrobiales bacterium]|nr:hypothetical protein [Verrucomicrobiales bacterium]